MWTLLCRDVLTHLSTDHASTVRGQKQKRSIWDAHVCLPGLDTTRSALLDATYLRGRRIAAGAAPDGEPRGRFLPGPGAG